MYKIFNKINPNITQPLNLLNDTKNKKITKIHFNIVENYASGLRRRIVGKQKAEAERLNEETYHEEGWDFGSS